MHHRHSAAWKEECSPIIQLQPQCKGEKLKADSSSEVSPERQEHAVGRQDVHSCGARSVEREREPAERHWTATRCALSTTLSESSLNGTWQGNLFSAERILQAELKNHRQREKLFFLMEAVLLSTSIGAMSLALEMWAESGTGIGPCWRETGVTGAQGTREMWAQIWSILCTSSYRAEDPWHLVLWTIREHNVFIQLALGEARIAAWKDL